MLANISLLADIYLFARDRPPLQAEPSPCGQSSSLDRGCVGDVKHLDGFSGLDCVARHDMVAASVNTVMDLFPSLPQRTLP